MLDYQRVQRKYFKRGYILKGGRAALRKLGNFKQQRQRSASPGTWDARFLSLKGTETDGFEVHHLNDDT